MPLYLLLFRYCCIASSQTYLVINIFNIIIFFIDMPKTIIILLSIVLVRYFINSYFHGRITITLFFCRFKHSLKCQFI